MPLSTDGMYSLGIEPPTNLLSNDVAGAGLLRNHVDDDVAVLAAATGLASELHVDLVDALAGGLAVRDLRLADVGLDLELAQQAVDDDLEVQLAHAGDDRLTGLRVRADAEGRVLLGELGERVAELVLLGLGLRLDRDVDDRIREDHRLEQHRVRHRCTACRPWWCSSGRRRRRCRRPRPPRCPRGGWRASGADDRCAPCGPSSSSGRRSRSSACRSRRGSTSACRRTGRS